MNARDMLFSVGARELGNARGREGVAVAAVAVQHDVPARTTVAGVPARVL